MASTQDILWLLPLVLSLLWLGVVGPTPTACLRTSGTSAYSLGRVSPHQPPVPIGDSGAAEEAAVVPGEPGDPDS